MLALIIAAALAQGPPLQRDLREVFAEAQRDFAKLALESLGPEERRLAALGRFRIGDTPRSAEMRSCEERFVRDFASRPRDQALVKSASELLGAAARSAMVDVIKALLAGGADPEAQHRGRSALSWAIFADSADAVRAFVEGGADAAGSEESPISHTLTPRVVVAADVPPWRPHAAEIVAVLLDHGAGIDAPVRERGGADASTALVKAAERGNASLLQLLLDRGAMANYVVPQNGHTALMSAAGWPNAARVLLDHGANLEATDHAGRSATIFAAMDGCAEAVAFLKSRGGRVDRPDQFGKTADRYLAEFSKDAVPQGICDPRSR